MKGIYLVFNQGSLIVEGKKTLIIKEKQVPEDYLDKEVYLCQDDLVLGIIKLSNEKIISLEEFEELKDKHQISEENRRSWWSDAESFYSYDVEVVEAFKKPKPFKLEQGVQTYIQEVKLKKEITTTDDIDHLEILYDAEKLHLEEFKAKGVDYDLKHPKTRYKQLFADLRYLGNDGYPKLKANEKWGVWDLKTLLEYFAKIIDVLRSCYFSLIPKDDKNSFWDCYREAEQYMKSRPPKEEEVVEWDKKREKLIKSISESEYVICEDCDVEIDYLAETECAMGAIKCPSCKSIIDQNGSLLNKKYDVINPETLKDKTDEEIEVLHKEAHKIYQLYEAGKFKDLELLVNNHILIVQEMLRRKMKHEKTDELDDESLEFSKDYDKDAKELLFKHEELHSFHALEIDDNFYDFKSLLERHDEIVKSLENFGIQHNSKEDFLDDYAEFIKKRNNLAAVHPSGEHNKYREVIKLEEILPYFKSFKLRSPFIYLTGGVINREYTTNDVDILINCTKEELDKTPLFQMLTWRLMRSLPRRYWNKIQFISNNWQGPITSNIPLYELDCLRVNLDNKIFQMSYQEDDNEFIKALIRTKNPKSERQAQKAKRTDTVTLGEFFLALKPTRGAFPYQRMTVESFLALFKDEDFPVWNSTKRDGFNNILIKDGKNVTILSEDGDETTSRFPSLVEEIKKLNVDQVVLLAEIEMWINKIHQPREAVSGYAHLKSEADDSNIVASVYDGVFYNKDIHNLGFAMRKQYLDKLNFKQSVNGIPNVDIKLNKIPHYLCKNREELRKTTEKLREILSSEGVVAKMADAKYNLAGKRSGMIKMHNNAAINVIVLDRQTTKVAGTFNYYYGIEIEDEKVDHSRIRKIGSNNYLLLGKTFSTTADLKMGDKFILEFETLNVEQHEKTNEIKLTCWVPRFIKETDEAIDTIKSTIAAAKKENHVLQEKDVLETGEIIYKSVEFEKQDPYEIIPSEDDAPYRYTVQRHFRGKSAHLDLRIESKDKKYLIGFTLMDLLPNKIKEPVLTMKDAAKVNSEDNYKIEWNKKPVKVKMRRTAAGNIVPAEIRAATKAAEPCLVAGSLVWTSEGLKEIEKIREGEFVLSAFGKWVKVIKNGRIRLHSTLIKMQPKRGLHYLITKQHPILKATFFSNYTNLPYLSDSFIGHKQKNYRIKTEFLPAENIKRGDFLVFPKIHPTNEIKELPYQQFLQNGKEVKTLFVPINFSFGYLVGLFLGDGHFGPKEVHFSLNKEKLDKALPILKPFIEDFLSRSLRIRKSQTSNYYKIAFPDGKFRDLMRILVSQGKHGTNHRKALSPVFLEKTNTDFLLGLKEGLLDSDGSFTKKRNSLSFVNSWRNLISTMLFTEILLGTPNNFTFRYYFKFGKQRLIHRTCRLNQTRREFLEDENNFYMKVKQIKNISEANKHYRYVYNLQTENSTFCLCNFATHNSEWLDVTGITERGEVGATKDFPGVFTIIDKGVVEYGSMKPYFKELFFGNQSKLQGRWVFRQIAEYRREEKTKGILPSSLSPERPETSGFFWVFIMPLDQTPYVLSDRAVKKSWISPVNYSALPSELKKKVPSEFQYWKAAKESDRIRIRNSYVDWLKENKKYDELKKCGSVEISEGQRPRIDEVMILSRYLSCDIKDIFPKALSIPRVRAGNYFDSVIENTKNCTLVEIRNFAGCEIPPIYQEIQLKKNLTKTFLIEGFYFFHDEEKQIPFILQVTPVWGGFIIKIISRTKDKDFNLELSKKIEQHAKDNNMLKGEKFTISGEFIDSHNLTWDDIKLSVTIKDKLKHLDYLIQNNDQDLASRGLIFIGPPGCGKTLTGKILSTSKPTFIWVTTKDFSECYPKTAITTAFSLARELSPTILFLEDIDSYLEKDVIDLMKTELDGLQLNKGIFTVLTSNFPEKLPEALIDRPGRFHDVLYFSLPNEEIREEMFTYFLKDEVYNPEILEVLIRKTNSFSGAHIREICDFAKIIKKEDNISLAKALMTSLDRVIEQRKLIASFKNNVISSEVHKFITEEDLNINKSIGTFKFVLQYHSFKRWNWKEDRPVVVVRSGKSEEHWDLRIDTDKLPILHWVLDNDPREVQSTTALYKPCNDKSSMDKGKPNENKDYLKPGTSEYNPTKDTRAWLELEDSGEAIITIDKPMFKRVELKGKTLKGLFILEREDEKSDFWTLSRSKLPVTKKEEK